MCRGMVANHPRETFELFLELEKNFGFTFLVYIGMYILVYSIHAMGAWGWTAPPRSALTEVASWLGRDL